MSIYPCDFDEAWAPLIPPTKPNNYNSQNEQMKKIISDTNINNPHDSNNTISGGGLNGYYGKEQYHQSNQIEHLEQMEQLRRNNQIEKNLYQQSHFTSDNSKNMSNKQLLQHLRNCEKTMYKIMKMIELNNIENDYKRTNKVNDILFYVLMGVIVSYIVFSLVNRQK